MTDSDKMEEYLERILSDNETDDCPIQLTLELLRGKWRAHIIYELFSRPSCRFNELMRAIPGITRSTLTTTLKDLERAGILLREQFNEMPLRVEYSLTEKGRALIPVLYELSKWGETYLMNEPQRG